MDSREPGFVRTEAGSFHPIIDGPELARALAGAAPPAAGRRLRVMGPYDLHMLERARSRHGMRTPFAVPADLFVWAIGEPRHPAITKLGGVPYLPADRAWPERDGTTADFYGQLNFLDSKDLMPELPGDVLLVFRFHDLDYTSWDEELYEFVWVDVNDQELLCPDQVRCSANGGRDPWPAMHAYRTRSFDDPSQVERVRGDSELCPVHNAEAAKIGGIATDMQSIEEPEVPEDWRFLGQLIGLFPTTGHPHALTLATGPGNGVTCLYLDGRGAVRVFFSCS